MNKAAQALEHLKKQITSKMESKNLTPSSVEKKSGLKISAVRNILVGKSTNPGIEILIAVAKTLECSVDELLGLESRHHSCNTAKEPMKTIENHIWNAELYKDALKVTENLIAEKNLTLSLEQMLSVTKEIYLYSLNGSDNKADKRFAQWIIENNLAILNIG